MPPTVPNLVRLAVSPRIDGVLEPEEWDELGTSGSGKTYFQWEPGKLHLAAVLPAGQEVLGSFDIRGDGWLKGRDNLEVRLALRGREPSLTARFLDATRAEGPAWFELPRFLDASRVAASPRGDYWVVEATLVDPGYFALPVGPIGKFGLRVDLVEEGLPELEPYLPRALAPASLDYLRATDKLPMLRWKPELKTKSVAPNEEIRIRYTWTATEDEAPRKIELRAEGLARDEAASITRPFPAFDSKKRAFVDYDTRIAGGADLGWRLLRGTLTTLEGDAIAGQTSFRIAPILDFDIVPITNLRTSEEPQVLKVTSYLRSNVPKRLDGEVTLDLPPGWEARKGVDKRFIITSPRGSVRRVLELVVPPHAVGPYPLVFKATMGEQVVEQTVWVLVREER
ncbi:MAG TPA: hypothetical protein VM328_11995 [Fimbriimonadaceae bacterium]|nr:hypothetical protein [Fimbriimonadaceae bacterium]